MIRTVDHVVVGAGLVGLATARALLRESGSSARVLVLEKEGDVALHQSGRNSGVLHAGLAYKPGTAKARLATAGLRMMEAYCDEHAIRRERCGKLVVAASPDELPRLEALLEQGTRNGLEGLRLLDERDAREVEPEVRCLAALHVPGESIVDFGGVARRLKLDVEQAGGEIRFRAPVTKVIRRPDAWLVQAGSDWIVAGSIVNCAGLHADRIARLCGTEVPERIVPFRGEYFELRPERRGLVRALVYPAPDPRYPFLGVHFTRTVDGRVLAGPNAVLAGAREGYSRTTVNLRDLAGTLAFPGLWRFARRHWRTVAEQGVQSASPARFVAALQRLVPSVRREDLVPARAGVRAQAMSPDGTLLQDFVFRREGSAFHVISAPSPGATASLAIADHVVATFLHSSP